MQQTIFCFTGLGADEKLFANISVPGFRLKHIQYVKPILNETLPAYAQRLSFQIDEANPILMGVSFGGMLVVEVAKYLAAKKAIIISSTKSADFFPAYYQFANQIGLLKLLPAPLFKTTSTFTYYLFGAHTANDKALLYHFIKSADSNFIKWALRAIINWKNKSFPEHLIHIHGSKDRIIPLPKNVDFVINQGGHLMVFNRANEINQLLQNCLTANR